MVSIFTIRLLFANRKALKRISLGNGVENAYNFTSKVLTLSFHKHEAGFYPGTGDVKDIGIGKGRYYTINVPLKEGMNNSAYHYLFEWYVLAN